MGIPGRVAGAGNNSVARYVLKVTFSQALSAPPNLKAWDDFNANSTNHAVFTGTTGNGNIPMISAVATTDAAPANADWKPAAPTAGGATINRLKGDEYYVVLSNAAPAAGESVMFNLCWEIPSDCPVPTTDDPDILKAVFVVEVTYSGAPPVLTWWFNDLDAGGSESGQVWTQITPGASGNQLKPADAGCSSSYIVLHKPPSGVADNPELWVV